MNLRFGFCAAALALCALTVVPASAQRTGRTSSGNSSSSSNSNNTANSPMAMAAKAVTKAEVDVRHIQADINVMKLKARNQLLTKPEWASVVAAKKKAETSLEQAKKSVLNTLQKRTDYRQLADERETARKQIEGDQNGTNKLSDEELQKASGIIVKDGLAMKQMESAALKDDPKYAAAKEEYDAANAKMADLDPQVEQALKDDKDYQTKADTLDKAKGDLENARKQLAQARQAAEQQREQEAKSREGASRSNGGRRG